MRILLALAIVLAGAAVADAEPVEACAPRPQSGLYTLAACAGADPLGAGDAWVSLDVGYHPPSRCLHMPEDGPEELPSEDLCPP